MSFIEVAGLYRTYKTMEKKKGVKGFLKSIFRPDRKIIRAVNNISFRIDAGEAVGFIGPNGAGKSTTMKMLTGILMPDAGSVSVNGFVPYRERKKYTATIGAVFGQRTQLWWDLPVSDTFELLKYVYRIDAKTYKDNLALFNNILGLEEFFNQPVRQLSLGQRMRADLAAALLHNPPCLFLDEPTIGLDVVAKENIRQFITSINRERGTTILFTTHDMSDIEKTCSRMIIIDHGIIIYDGSIDHIKKQYGKERSLEIDFNREYPDIDIPGTTVKHVTNLKKRITFERTRFRISELINRITSDYDVLDLTIKEPEIESIIRKIYESGTADVQDVS